MKRSFLFAWRNLRAGQPRHAWRQLRHVDRTIALRICRVRTLTLAGWTVRSAVLLNDWAVPVGWRYDFPGDCWHIVILCWHARFWPNVHPRVQRGFQ